jgi:WD40 repeat protein
LLAEQIERSSALEQKLLRVLAVERGPVSLAELITELGPRVRQAAVLEAVEALRRRSLLERAGAAGVAAFTLQSVVLEYVTNRLVEEVGYEIAQGHPVQLVEQPLIKAQAKDYVRKSQERLIGAPILQQLEAEHGDDAAEQRLVALLDGWRNRPEAEQGYGPGNVVNLLRLQRGELRALNVGRLAIRQAYLAEVEAQDASLAGAHLAEAVLAQAFNFPLCVALSSDGAFLVAGTVTGEVWLWRVADRTQLLAVQGHIGLVSGVALNADGRLLASGGEDGMVRLWEASTGRLLAALQGHTGGVRSVGLSADGRLLVSGGFDGTVRLWSFAPRQAQNELRASGDVVEPLATLQGHIGPVYRVALTADGRLLASGGWDGTVRLWSVAVRQAQGELRTSGDAVEPLATLQAPTSGVWSLALSADGRLVASGGLDGTLRVWDTANGGTLLTTIQAHAGPAYGVALSLDGRLLVSGSIDGTIRLWDGSSGQPLGTLQGHIGAAYSVALSPDGWLVASGGEDGTVRLWEHLDKLRMSGDWRLLAILQGLTSAVSGVALSADRRWVASGGQDGTVRLWDVTSGRLLATAEAPSGLVFCVDISADGRLLVSGNLDGAVRLWDAPVGRLLATLHGHTGAVYGVAFAADGRLLTSGGLDGTVRMWESPNGRLLGTVQSHTGAVLSVTLSTDGGLLASGGADGTVRLFTAPCGRPLATLQGHSSAVQGVALSADGRLLASASRDDTVRLWESPSGRPVATLQAHPGGVRGVALSADGRLLASGGLDGTARLWRCRLGGCWPHCRATPMRSGASH